MAKSKKYRRRQRELGMDRSITRRDILNGVAIGASALAAQSMFGSWTLAAADPHGFLAAAQDRPSYYPPLLQGMRGNHPGAFEDAHRLSDGRALPRGEDTGEHFDLIVVGGGISGLAAAYFYREQHGTRSKILVLDNHDDFGGHAKRNEFRFGSRTALLNGGTLSIDSPRPYGLISSGLLQSLGIDVAALAKTIQHPELYESMGLRPAAFFDRETFGADYLACGIGKNSWNEV